MDWKISASTSGLSHLWSSSDKLSRASYRRQSHRGQSYRGQSYHDAVYWEQLKSNCESNTATRWTVHENSGHFRQKSNHASANGISQKVSVLIVMRNRFQFCRPPSEEIERRRRKGDAQGSCGYLTSWTICTRLASSIFFFAEKTFQILPIQKSVREDFAWR